MLRLIKLMIPGVVIIFLLSIILTGCYTQLSRPRVATEDQENELSESEDVEVYDQDQGAPPYDSRDVYIYNFWDGYYGGYPYRHFWRDYYWGYTGPYPYYWWDPYSHWWTPGWYIGFYTDYYWWSGYPYHYYDPYYRYGYYSQRTRKIFDKQPFDRRAARLGDRKDRVRDQQTSLAKPQAPSRTARSRSVLRNPTVRDQSNSAVKQRRATSEVETRARRAPEQQDTVKKERPEVQKQPRTSERKSELNAPRPAKSSSQPRIIETAPARPSENVPRQESYTPPQRSHRNDASSANVSGTRTSRPQTPSYTPRSNPSSPAPAAPRPSSSSGSSRSSSSGSSKKSKD